MTWQELAGELQALGYPVVYHSFKEPKAPPFITIAYVNNNDLIADNFNYKDIGNYQVELYTKNKNTAVEQEVESVLKSNKLAYSKLEFSLESENLRQIVYELNII